MWCFVFFGYCKCIICNDFFGELDRLDIKDVFFGDFGFVKVFFGREEVIVLGWEMWIGSVWFFFGFFGRNVGGCGKEYCWFLVCLWLGILRWLEWLNWMFSSEVL